MPAKVGKLFDRLAIWAAATPTGDFGSRVVTFTGDRPAHPTKETQAIKLAATVARELITKNR